MSFQETIDRRLSTLVYLKKFDFNVDTVGLALVECLKTGGKIVTCGNGGSAAEASHFVAELMGRFKENRRSLPAYCLNSDSSLLTCLGNDYGYQKVFARQLEAIYNPNDLVFLFTTSGKSRNILEIIKIPEIKNTVLISGNSGGLLKGLTKFEVIVPSEETAVIQEMHLLLIHYWCSLIDSVFAGHDDQEN